MGDGAVLEWDVNAPRQLHFLQGFSNVVAVTTGYDFTAVLMADGTVAGLGWLGSIPFVAPSGLSNVIAIAGGDRYCLALKQDGTVVGWGDTNYGGVSLAATVPAGLTAVTAISANNLHSLALKNDGTVVSWGYGYRGGQQTNVPAGLSNVVSVASGSDHSLALRSDGTVSAWGDNSDGQTSVPAGLSNVIAISAGGYSSVALKDDGTIVAWGKYSFNEPYLSPNFAGVVAVSGADSFLLALGGHPPAAFPAVANLLATDKVGAGGTAVFSVTATGSLPLSYQWQFNGTNIDGAIGPSLILNDVQSKQSGDYSVTISNYLGAITNVAVTLRVDNSPVVTPSLLVTNLSDSGPGSLRQAILDANLSTSANTIGFHTLGTIQLYSALPEIFRNTSVVGPGKNLLSVSGNYRSRVFAFGEEATNAISGITIANGWLTNEHGAGIYNISTLSLTNCALTFNTATGVGDGGGIFNSGTLIIDHCLVANNEARSGGGINNSGRLTVADSTFVKNGTIGGSGGGIYNSGNLGVSGSSVSDSYASGNNGIGKFGQYALAGAGSGGGLFTAVGDVIITNCTFSRNSALGGNGVTLEFTSGGQGSRGGDASGGGVYQHSGQLTIVNSTVSSNSASGGRGGGGVTDGGGDGGGAHGGGIFVSNGSFVLRATTFCNNMASGGFGGDGGLGGGAGGDTFGGGLALSMGAGELENCTFFLNSAQGGTGGDRWRTICCLAGRGGEAGGGALYAGAGTVALRNCTVAQNRAVGGLSGREPGSTGAGLPSYAYGGGVHSSSGLVSLINTLVSGNASIIGNNMTNSPDGYGSFMSQGYNLIGNSNGISGLIESDLRNVDPQLGPLQDYGGPTWTQALLPSSPAIDAGTGSGAPSVDQRGFPRPSGRGYDIGAYEFVGPSQITLSSDRVAQVEFIVWTNQIYPIQATTDFLSWLTIGTVPVSPNGQFIFQDATHLPMRFYRLVLSP